ncbi:MAG: hypothetical protein QM662_17775 [Gordonia sp. (in: high G+C Gram-positive bacteria)]
MSGLPDQFNFAENAVDRIEHRAHVLLVGVRERELSSTVLDEALVTLTVDPFVVGGYSAHYRESCLTKGRVDLYNNWRGMAGNGSLTVLIDPESDSFVVDEEGTFPRLFRSVYLLVFVDALADVVSVDRYLRRRDGSSRAKAAVRDYARFSRMRTEWDVEPIRAFPLQSAVREAIHRSFDLEQRIARAEQIAQARLTSATAVSSHATELLLLVLGVVGIIGVGFSAVAFWNPTYSQPAPWLRIVCVTVAFIAIAAAFPRIMNWWHQRRIGG